MINIINMCILIITGLYILYSNKVQKNAYTSYKISLIVSILIIITTISDIGINSEITNSYSIYNEYINSIEATIINETESNSSINAIPSIEYNKYLQGINSTYNYDGLTKILIILVIIISPISLISINPKRFNESIPKLNLEANSSIACILFVEALLIGTFITQNFLVFYILFESVLIPMFYLIGVNGSGVSKSKWPAAFRLFIYTLAGSLLMLLAIIYLSIEIGSLNWYNLIGAVTEHQKSDNYRLIIFWFIFIALALKIPMVPLHLWLPEAHTLAPTSGSIILAALLLKLGSYGILKWLIPLFPLESYYSSPLILAFSACGSIYGGLVCLRQIDIKRIIAYSSIVHMNISVFSIFTLSSISISGAIFELFSHGLISSGLFFLIGVLYNRFHTRILKYFSGLGSIMPLYSLAFLFFVLANSAFPLTSGFIGEILMLTGSFAQYPFLTLLIALSTLINATYNIWLFNRLIFGKVSYYIYKCNDINFKEAITLLSLSIWILVLGLQPHLILNLI